MPTRIDQVKPQRQNANRHTPRGMKVLEESIQQDGWISAITVAADGEAFDGSARVEVGVTQGFEDAIVVRSDGSKPVIHIREDIPTADDPRAKRLGIAANRVAQLNLDWEPELLTQLRDEGDLPDSLFNDAELAEILSQLDKPEGAGGDEFDTTPQDGPTRVQTGELWQLGSHRLLCGDSTKQEDVARLMGGELADLVWTDPPYGVGYQDNESIESLRARNRRTDGKVVQNDSLTEKDTEILITLALGNAEKSSVPGGACYVACPAGTLLPYFISAFNASGFGFRHSLVWVKDQFVFGRADYHYRHEIILYGWKKGTHYFVDNRTHSSVFEVERPRTSDDHPTMKPVELISQMVENSSRHGENVYDPFLGSGTTLIAAERTGRKCYGMEISERYCDVILRRWEAETGREAVRLG